VEQNARESRRSEGTQLTDPGTVVTQTIPLLLKLPTDSAPERALFLAIVAGGPQEGERRPKIIKCCYILLKQLKLQDMTESRLNY
jgi:hypothetical protein